MKTILALLLVVVLCGCTSNARRGSRLLPWNWFNPDHATQLGEAEKEKSVASNSIVDAAHRDVAKVVTTLQLDPEPNKYTTQALRFARHGLGLLDQVKVIPFEQAQADQQLVSDLLSENVQIRGAALKRQSADEEKSNELAADLAKAIKKQAALTEDLKASDLQYQAQAEKYRRVIFWIWVVVGGWILLQALSGIARFYPALAPVAKFAGMVSAPAVQGAYNRLATGAGRALADAEKISATTAETLRKLLDDNTDVPDQKAIKAQYEATPIKP